MKHLFFAFVIFGAQIVLAGHEGGGGAYVRIGNEMVISDLFYRSVSQVKPSPIKAVAYKDLPDSLHRAMDNVLGFTWDVLYMNRLRGFVQANDQKLYYLVPKNLEDRAFCNLYVPEVNTPMDEVFQFGCTNGNITYLFVDKFEKASLREQAYALLHERLWTLKDDMSQEEVVAIVKGIHLSEDLVLKQRDGDATPLTKEEKESLENFRKVGISLGLIDDDMLKYDLSEHGGWIYQNCLDKQSSDFVIGAGSFIGCYGNGPMMIKSSVIVASRVSGLSIENSNIFYSQVYIKKMTWSEIGRTYLNAQESIGTETNPVRMIGSDIAMLNLSIQEGSNMEKTSIAVYRDGLIASLRGVHFTKANFKIHGQVAFQPGVVIEDVDVEFRNGECKKKDQVQVLSIVVHNSVGQAYGTMTDGKGNMSDYTTSCKPSLSADVETSKWAGYLLGSNWGRDALYLYPYGYMEPEIWFSGLVD